MYGIRIQGNTQTVVQRKEHPRSSLHLCPSCVHTCSWFLRSCLLCDCWCVYFVSRLACYLPFMWIHHFLNSVYFSSTIVTWCLWKLWNPFPFAMVISLQTHNWIQILNTVSTIICFWWKCALLCLKQKKKSSKSKQDFFSPFFLLWSLCVEWLNLF